MDGDKGLEARYDAVIGAIYEASYHPDRWPQALSGIAELTRSNSSALIYMNNGQPDANLTFSYNVCSESVYDYMTKYGALDPFAELVASNPLCVAASDTQMVPDRKELEALCGEFFDYMVKYDHYHIGGAALFVDDERMAAIAVQRGRKAGPWPDECMDRLTRVAPHVQRAFRIHTEFTRLRSQAETAYAGLDKLMIGIVLLDATGRITYTNPIASTIIRHHPALDIRRDRLCAADADEHKRLETLIGEAQRSYHVVNEYPSHALGLHHPELSVPLPVLVLPIGQTLLARRYPHESSQVAVVISDPMRPRVIAPEALMEIYALTEAEAQVAIAVANGTRLDGIAEERGKSVHTVRNQLKSVFLKTNTTNQGQLVKLLLSGPFGAV